MPKTKCKIFLVLFFTCSRSGFVSKRNDRGRQATTLDKKLHRQMKIIAARFDLTIEKMLDDCVTIGLKMLPLPKQKSND